MGNFSFDVFKRGLFVPLGAAEKAPEGAPLLRLGDGSVVNPAPFYTAIAEMSGALKAFNKNPYATGPVLHMRRIGMAMQQGLQQVPPSIRTQLGPMMNGLATFVTHSRYLLNLRLKTAYHLARSPKILIPVCISQPAGTSLVGYQARNPYLGASGGETGGLYNAPWAITGFRTSNNESGQIQAVRITQFLLGGHDFVAASLAGVTYTGGGAPATLGWPAAAFCETARKNWMSTIQPWNVVALSGEGVGFGSVMTETGFLQLAISNGNAATYNDTYSIYANATLCGNPFANARWTQIDMFRSAFVSLSAQAGLAQKLAMDHSAHITAALGGAAPNQPPTAYDYVTRMARARDEFDAFSDNPPGDAAMGDSFADPGTAGFSLGDGASYA